MALFFITGVSGSGKSSLVHELRSRGFEAYDTDDDGFSKWQHNETGYVHPKSSVKSKDRTPEFLSVHSWNVPREEIEDLTSRAQDQSIFLCGVIDNEGNLRDLFTACFALVIDSATMKHRLLTRTNNDWGKQPHELQASLNRLDKLLTYYKTHNFILVDATQDLPTIADTIVDQSIKLAS